MKSDSDAAAAAPRILFAEDGEPIDGQADDGEPVDDKPAADLPDLSPEDPDARRFSRPLLIDW